MGTVVDNTAECSWIISIIIIIIIVITIIIIVNVILPEICGRMGMAVVGNTVDRSYRLAVEASTGDFARVGPMDFSSQRLWSFLQIWWLFLLWLKLLL